MSNSDFINRRPRAVKKLPIVETNLRKSKGNEDELIPNLPTKRKRASSTTNGPDKSPKSKKSKLNTSSTTSSNKKSTEKVTRTQSTKAKKKSTSNTKKIVTTTPPRIKRAKREPPSAESNNNEAAPKVTNRNSSSTSKKTKSVVKDVNSNVVRENGNGKSSNQNSKAKKSSTKKKVSLTIYHSESIPTFNSNNSGRKDTKKSKSTKKNKLNAEKDPYSTYDFTSSDEEDCSTKKSKSNSKKNSKEALSSPPFLNQTNGSTGRRGVFSAKSPVVASYTFFTKGSGGHHHASTAGLSDTNLTATALAAKRKESIATERRQCAEATFLLPLPNNSQLPASSGSIENFMKQPDKEEDPEDDESEEQSVTNELEEEEEEDVIDAKCVASTPLAHGRSVKVSSKKDLMKSLEDKADLELSKISNSSVNIELFDHDGDEEEMLHSGEM